METEPPPDSRAALLTRIKLGVSLVMSDDIVNTWAGTASSSKAPMCLAPWLQLRNYCIWSRQHIRGAAPECFQIGFD